MDGYTAVARLETLADRLSALDLAEHLFTKEGRGTGDLIDMRQEIIEEHSEIIDKLRAVNL